MADRHTPIRGIPHVLVPALKQPKGKELGAPNSFWPFILAQINFKIFQDSTGKALSEGKAKSVPELYIVTAPSRKRVGNMSRAQDWKPLEVGYRNPIETGQ